MYIYYIYYITAFWTKFRLDLRWNSVCSTSRVAIAPRWSRCNCRQQTYLSVIPLTTVPFTDARCLLRRAACTTDQYTCDHLLHLVDTTRKQKDVRYWTDMMLQQCVLTRGLVMRARMLSTGPCSWYALCTATCHTFGQFWRTNDLKVQSSSCGTPINDSGVLVYCLFSVPSLCYC